jgi:hypothetical protein
MAERLNGSRNLIFGCFVALMTGEFGQDFLAVLLNEVGSRVRRRQYASNYAPIRGRRPVLTHKVARSSEVRVG